jgi:hypothetical protein
MESKAPRMTLGTGREGNQIIPLKPKRRQPLLEGLQRDARVGIIL